MKLYKIDDLVVIPKIKNRWGVPCAANITNINEDGSVNCLVWNMDGPGADREVINIPISELEK